MCGIIGYIGKKGKKRREQMTFDAHNMEEMKDEGG